LKATVIIPTHNRSHRLSALLHCLRAQSGDHLLRVVVCDDGSADDTRQVAHAFTDRLPLVYCHQENRGFRAGQARNLGMARAVGDVIVFVDDDALVAPDFVAAHIAAHARGERRMAVGYRHRAFGFDGEHPSWEDIVAGSPDDRAAVLGADAAGLTTHASPWIYSYSCNLSVTRSDEVRFDDGFVGWGMEDIEFGYRLHRAGYRMVAAPRARVLHIEDPNPRDPFRCEERQLAPKYDSYIRNSIYFMDKYPDDEALAAFVRADVRWYVRDDARGCWVKNGYANDADAVIAHCRRERAQAIPQRRAEKP
jgi:glycosyltransferase involved in cell wall biosynthesis